jgi:hypothetical protein
MSSRSEYERALSRELIAVGISGQRACPSRGAPPSATGSGGAQVHAVVVTEERQLVAHLG